MHPVDYDKVSSLFNLPPMINDQANDQLIDIIKQTDKPAELSPLDMLITPDDVLAIASFNYKE
jgi:hypothetical protein